MPISYTYQTAAAATGYSEDTLRNAVRTGYLEMRYPIVNGKPLSKGVIPAAALAAWIAGGADERPAA